MGPATEVLLAAGGVVEELAFSLRLPRATVERLRWSCRAAIKRFRHLHSYVPSMPIPFGMLFHAHGSFLTWHARERHLGP